eukprot:1747625-Pyramimonas_sp.AAC.1
MASVQICCIGMVWDCQGASVTLIRRVDAPETVHWHASGSSGCSSHVDSLGLKTQERYLDM